MRKLPEVATQTSRKLLPDVATQTSKGLLPDLKSRTSCMKTTPPSSRPPAERRKLRFKLVTQCLVEEPSDCSTCASSNSKQSSESNMPATEPEASPATCFKRKEEKKMDRRLAAALKYKEELERKKESERMIEDSPSECSTCESTPTESSECCSYQEDKEDESEYLAQEQMVIWEEEALKERLEKEKKRYHESCK